MWGLFLHREGTERQQKYELKSLFWERPKILDLGPDVLADLNTSFLTILTTPPLAWPCLSIAKRTSWSSSSGHPVGLPGLAHAQTHGWWLWLKLLTRRNCSLTWRQEQWHILYLYFYALFLSFLLPASEWLCPNCFLPMARCTNSWQGQGQRAWAKKHPRNRAAMWVTTGQPRMWSCDFIYGYTWSLDALLVLVQWHI